MIIFNGTRSLRDEFFLCFSNDKGSSIEIPVTEQMKDWFTRYLDRLSPPTKEVESKEPSGSK